MVGISNNGLVSLQEIIEFLSQGMKGSAKPKGLEFRAFPRSFKISWAVEISNNGLVSLQEIREFLPQEF